MGPVAAAYLTLVLKLVDWISTFPVPWRGFFARQLSFLEVTIVSYARWVLATSLKPRLWRFFPCPVVVLAMTGRGLAAVYNSRVTRALMSLAPQGT